MNKKLSFLGLLLSASACFANNYQIDINELNRIYEMRAQELNVFAMTETYEQAIQLARHRIYLNRIRIEQENRAQELALLPHIVAQRRAELELLLPTPTEEPKNYYFTDFDRMEDGLTNLPRGTWFGGGC